MLTTSAINPVTSIITRRMLSIVGERELRLHSDSHVKYFPKQ